MLRYMPRHYLPNLDKDNLVAYGRALADLDVYRDSSVIVDALCYQMAEVMTHDRVRSRVIGTGPEAVRKQDQAEMDTKQLHDNAIQTLPLPVLNRLMKHWVLATTIGYPFTGD